MSHIKLFWHCKGGRVVCTGEHRQGKRTLRYQRREPLAVLKQLSFPEVMLEEMAEQVHGWLAVHCCKICTTPLAYPEDGRWDCTVCGPLHPRTVKPEHGSRPRGRVEPEPPASHVEPEGRPWRIKRRTLYRILTVPLWVGLAYLLGAAFAAGFLEAWAVLG